MYENLDLGQVKAVDPDSDEEKQLKSEGWSFVRERKIDSKEVLKTVFTAIEFLEDEKRIPGKMIPVIPMYGFRKYIDGIERYRGLVRKLKDANRLFNASISRLAESSAAAGDEIPILTDKQVEGLEDNWADKTSKAYQVINTLEDANGNDIPAGPVGYLKPPAIDPNTAASAEIVTQFVQRTTGNMSQDQIDPDASGVAIAKWQRLQNLNTQVMTDNIISAKKHSGKVYLSIAEEVYAGKLRTKRLINVDGSSKMAQINTDSLDDTGGPIQTNTVTGHRFQVDVEIGPQYESQREATVESLERGMNLVGPESKYFEPMMSMWLKNISGTGLDEVKEFNRREMIISGMTEPETEEEMKIAQAAANQMSPTDKLAEAAATQQQAEAANLMASAQQKMADKMKKEAETVEILEGIGKDPDGMRRVRYNPETGGFEDANAR